VRFGAGRAEVRPFGLLTRHSSLVFLRPARLERATYGFGGRHSIQLSYGRGAAVIIMAAPESTTDAEQPSRCGKFGQ
jgi:hypothetical protein